MAHGRENGHEVKLDIEGMSCASCAARIERALNKVEGVEAGVNFATERATVHCSEDVTTLILLGRYLEARAKGRSSEAIRKLLELGAKSAS